VEDEEKTYVPLVDAENGYAVLNEGGVTTINFFSANNVSCVTSVQKLKNRLRQICEANPWLVGKIVKDKVRQERLMCAFPNSIKDEDGQLVANWDDLEQQFQCHVDDREISIVKARSHFCLWGRAARAASAQGMRRCPPLIRERLQSRR